MTLISLLKLYLVKAPTVASVGLPIAFAGDLLNRLPIPKQLPDLNALLQKVIGNPYYLLPILAIVIIGCIIAAIAGRSKAKRNRLKKDVFRTPVSKLKPEDLGIEKYKNDDHYVPRESDEHLRRILEGGSPKVLVIGKTGAGKTRTLYEAIKERKDFVIAVPKHHTITPENSRKIAHSLRKKKVFLFLDDLDKYVKKVDIAMLIDQLENEAGSLTVLATCRTGDALDLVEKLEPSFLRHFENRIRIELRDLAPAEEEALAKSLDRAWSSTTYNHTPGSVALDLPDMKTRYKNTSNDGKAIIRLLKVLRSSLVHIYDEHLVKKLFYAASETESHERGNWGKALAEMVESGLIARKEGCLSVYDAYLDDDFVDDYTPSERDYEALETLLIREKDTEALFSMGIFYSTRDQLDKSISALEKAVEFNPDHIGARLCLGTAYEKTDMLEKALTQYEEIMKISMNNAEIHYRLGLIYYNQNMLDEAINEFKRTTNINPNHVEAHYNLAVAYEKKGLEDEAIAEYKETTRLGPGHLNAHRSLALIFNKRDMLAEAIQEFKQVTRINPNDAEAHYILASAYNENGKTQDAIHEYKELARINPDDVQAHYNLGVNYFRIRNFGGAIEAFKHVVSFQPHDIKAHYNLGLAYFKKDMVEDALKEYQEVSRLKPGDPAVYYNLALCYDRKGMLDEAIDGFKEAIRNYPNHPDAHCNLALTYNKKNMYDAAIAEFKEAIRIKPKDPAVHGGLALAYHKKGMAMEARKEFRIYEQLKAQTAKHHRR
ncbi:MAG: tetratricopeptide repeat protein [Planctomycetota bacterium]